MSKLSDTTKKTRKYIVYFLIFAIVVILIQNLVKIITGDEVDIDYENSPYAYVDENFGEVIYPEISSLAISSNTKPIFSVDGTFEKSPTSVNVYSVAKPRETLGSVEKAQSYAKYLQFIPESYRIDGSKIIWEDGQRTLEYDKVSRDLKYNNNALNSSSLATYSRYIDQETSSSRIRTINSQLTQYKTISITNETSLQKLVSNNLTTTYNFDEADLINDEYFINLEIVSLKSLINDEETQSEARSLIGKIYQDDPSIGITSMLVLNRNITNSAAQIETLKTFEEKGININSQKAVYKLLTKEEAWEDIKEGDGFLKQLIKQGTDPLIKYQTLEVSRFVADPNSTELGYFLPSGIIDYVYPIYIFKGRAELKTGETASFVFYTKAIKD